MRRAGETLFIADLHLDAARPAVTTLALDFLADARGAKALWILGDLFEAWLGDDIVDPAHGATIDALTALSNAGTAVHLMHGNRDFLLGDAFAARVGARLHRDDEKVIAADEGVEPVLLLHGDTLCTGDVDYQRLRARLREATWQAEFLSGTAEERIGAAKALRERSREAVAGKAGGIMDVAPDAVAAAFARSGCRTMIHGHTHRPADHRPSDERAAGRSSAGEAVSAATLRRVVLGDWHDDHARYALHDGTTLSLETWRRLGG